MTIHEFPKHGVLWEFSEGGSAVIRNGYVVPSGPICPIDKADLVGKEIVRDNDDLYWRDSVEGEQVFVCPDCKKEFRFPFVTLEELHRDVYSSYKGARRRGEIKDKHQNVSHESSHKNQNRQTKNKPDITQQIVNQFFGQISQMNQGADQKGIRQINKQHDSKSIWVWIRDHIISVIIAGVIVGVVVAYISFMLGWI